MGNLGKYQEIVEAAKAVGGVDNLIEGIEAGAVSKATPSLLGKGAVLGVLGVAAAKVATVVVTRALDARKARMAHADDAKEQLRAVAHESKDGDGSALVDVNASAEDGEASVVDGDDASRGVEDGSNGS